MLQRLVDRARWYAAQHRQGARLLPPPTFIPTSTPPPTPVAISTPGTHTATLTLIAADTNALDGFNFNGYGHGQMVITIPVGSTVTVIFTNKSTVPHSAVITDYSNRLSNGVITPAFPGASTPNPVAGTPQGQTVSFTFVASTVGTYAIVCGVPGHAVAGMWDVLKVT
jgi:sulfocyanin